MSTMDTNIPSHKVLEPDDLDIRIEQLIAKYKPLCDACEKHRDDVKTRKSCPAVKKLTGIVGSQARIHAYPSKFTYKFKKPNNSGEEEFNRNIPVYPNFYDNETDDSDSSCSGFSCSKEHYRAAKSRSIIKYQDYNKDVSIQASLGHVAFHKKIYAEKPVQCQPNEPSHNEDLVSRVIMKNAKLQMLLTKYVISRQKERQNEKWNNYVDMIKGKNNYYRELTKQFSSQKNTNLQNNGFIDTDVDLRHSDSCRKILHNLYDDSEEQLPEYLSKCKEIKPSYDNIVGSARDHLRVCFSSSSQTECHCKSRDNHESLNAKENTCNTTETKITEINNLLNAYKAHHYLKPNLSGLSIGIQENLQQNSIVDIKEGKKVQTHITFGSLNNNEPDSKDNLEPELQIRDKKTRTAFEDTNTGTNTAVPEQNHNDTKKNLNSVKKCSDVNIQSFSMPDLEGKLDTLLDLLNSFVSNSISKVTSDNEKPTNDKEINDDQDKIETEASSEPNTKKKVTIVGNVMTNTSLCTLGSQLTPSHYTLNMRLNKILCDEIYKSNQLKSEVEAMLHPIRNPPCTVRINMDVPTKERSTGVTESLSKTKLVSISDRLIAGSNQNLLQPQNKRDDRRVAINTEPLGLLTLLKLSTEAAKQIMSFIPDISAYLAKVPRPVTVNADYVCNICGAAFPRPSQLGAHILGHERELSQVRNCSVCRHAVDSRRPSQLFRCQHCGQRFTRAYCCELHEHGCARRVRGTDTSDFKLLR